MSTPKSARAKRLKSLCARVSTSSYCAAAPRVAASGAGGTSACGVFAFSSFWSIGELFQQRKRVEKGWFPKRDKK
jgi:hypothetical protein